MNRASALYYVAGALALIAGLVVILTDGFLPEERFHASVYVLWAAIMFALGYRRQQKTGSR